MSWVAMSLIPDDDALIVPTADAEATLVEVGAGEVPPVRLLSVEGAPLVFKQTRWTLSDMSSECAAVPSPWRLSYALASRSECRLLQTLLEDNGFTLTTTRAFNLLWLNCPVKPALLLSLNRYQKVNHFPGTHELTRKDLLARTMQKNK